MDLFPSVPLNSLPLSLPALLLLSPPTSLHSLPSAPSPASTPAPSHRRNPTPGPAAKCRPLPAPPPPLHPRRPAASDAAAAARSNPHYPPPPLPPQALPAAAVPRPRISVGPRLAARAMPARRGRAETRPLPPSGAWPRRCGGCGHPRRHPPPASVPPPPVSASRYAPAHPTPRSSVRRGKKKESSNF